jgi:hypothetical protein
LTATAGGQVSPEPAAQHVHRVGGQVLDHPPEVVDEGRQFRSTHRGAVPGTRQVDGDQLPIGVAHPVRQAFPGRRGRPEVGHAEHRIPGAVGIDANVPLVDRQVVDRAEGHSRIASLAVAASRPRLTGVGPSA